MSCSVCQDERRPEEFSGDSEPLEAMLIGRSPATATIREVILRIARTEASVLIHGERGTGKELVARAIHKMSRRAKGPFVPVNITAVPPGHAESFLFGHEKGRFAGDHPGQAGWCKAADGGTLFLDEIAGIESHVQPRLLRLVQDGMIQRGAGPWERVDVRVVAATHRDPREMVSEGVLREDLFFRLNVVPIHVPPLRERRDDIADLARVFLLRASAKHGRRAAGFAQEALDILRLFDWPGNVRQLENAVERLAIFAPGPRVEAADIPAEFHFPSLSPAASASTGAIGRDGADGSGILTREMTCYQRQERAVILDALQKTGGHVVRAAKLLGLGQATVYRKIKQYSIPRGHGPRTRHA